MRWATRTGVHVDRAACAWLIRRFLDPNADFLFVTDASDVPEDATAFDIRGAQLSHHSGHCTFETMLLHFSLTDPALETIGQAVHEADLADDVFDAPIAHGLDVLIRGIELTSDDDDHTLSTTDRIFDGLYEYTRRQLLTARTPA
jgi:hypothetical protein